jgi:hypothetical protein
MVDMVVVIIMVVEDDKKIPSFIGGFFISPDIYQYEN